MVESDNDERLVIKDNITALINQQKYDEAEILLEEYKNVSEENAEYYSMIAVLNIYQDNLEKAEEFLKQGLKIDGDNFDLNYNIGYLKSLHGDTTEAFIHYKRAFDMCSDTELKKEIGEILAELGKQQQVVANSYRKKVVFFVKQGMNSFLGNIINGLSDYYETKEVIVTEYTQIDEGMKWADICWFEWCDELIAYGSQIKQKYNKYMICRLHSYEAFTDYPTKVQWENIDKLIFVAEHIRENVLNKIKINPEKTCVISNGIDVNKYRFKERQKGFNIAYVGYINYKKGPMLLLHTFKAIYDKDNRYKLYIAGNFQDERYILYFNQMINEMGLQGSIIYDGWQNDINSWLEDKNYIISTSVLEGNPLGVMEAMSRGIKPLIHNFVGCKNQFGKYAWNTMDQCIGMVLEEGYNSSEYRKFIEENFSLDKQILSIKQILSNLKENSRINDNILLTTKNYLDNLTFDKGINNLTILIATYNRASRIIADLNCGYKLGNQRKVIVDDSSDKENKKLLKGILNKKNKFNIDEFIFHKSNHGIAEVIKTGLNNVKTKYTTLCGDDDLLLCFQRSDVEESINKLEDENIIVIPRYILNLDGEGNLSIGYDRISFKDKSCSDILKYITETSEMYALGAGMIALTNDMQKYKADSYFTVGEDYTMVSRLMGNNLNRTICINENYVYVRRISGNTLSKTLSEEKIILHLMSLLVAGYYCMKNQLLDKNSFINIILNRGKLLDNLYGKGMTSAQMIADYLKGEISKDQLLEYIQTSTVDKQKYQSLAEEIIKIANF